MPKPCCFPTAQELAEAIQTQERNNVTAVIENFAGTNSVSLAVPAGTRGVIRYVGDHGGGVVRMSINGIDPMNDTFSEFNARHTLNLHGVDLSMVRLNATATTSDYSIAYEIWN